MHGTEVKSLEDFRQRFNFIYEALEITESPTEASLRSLLFEQLKNHPRMSLHIDRFRNASSSSSKRTRKWLYDKMCEILEISQLEENAEALKPKTANANPAPKSDPSRRKDKAEKDKERKDNEEKERKEKEKKEKKKDKEKAKKARNRGFCMERSSL